MTPQFEYHEVQIAKEGFSKSQIKNYIPWNDMSSDALNNFESISMNLQDDPDDPSNYYILYVDISYLI